MVKHLGSSIEIFDRHGHEWRVDYIINPAEPDNGIPHDYVEVLAMELINADDFVEDVQTQLDDMLMEGEI